MKIAGAVGLICLTFLFACSSGGGEESLTISPQPSPFVAITQPTTERTFTTVCESEFISGDAGFGEAARCCNGTVVELTGARVTWRNAASGDSGEAFQSVVACSFFSLCNHTWSATVPLVLGSNRIVVTATDIQTGAARTDTITINKPAPSYTASGTLRTLEGIGVGYFESRVELEVSGGATRRIIPSSQSAAGQFQATCLPNGNYTIVPMITNTFNYSFMPPLRSFTVSGGNVLGLDFQTTAFSVTGRIQTATGDPLENRIVEISGGGVAWRTSTDNTGLYTFVVPNGTYTFTPDPSCMTCSFTPASQTVGVIGSSISGQDFFLN